MDLNFNDKQKEIHSECQREHSRLIVLRISAFTTNKVPVFLSRLNGIFNYHFRHRFWLLPNFQSASLCNWHWTFYIDDLLLLPFETAYNSGPLFSSNKKLYTSMRGSVKLNPHNWDFYNLRKYFTYYYLLISSSGFHHGRGRKNVRIKCRSEPFNGFL